MRTRWPRLAPLCDYCEPGRELADRDCCRAQGCVAERLRRQIQVHHEDAKDTKVLGVGDAAARP